MLRQRSTGCNPGIGYRLRVVVHAYLSLRHLREEKARIEASRPSRRGDPAMIEMDVIKDMLGIIGFILF